MTTPKELRASGATPMVEMNNISISFGGIKAVDDVSVDLHPGEVVDPVLGESVRTFPCRRVYNNK